jgi:pyruvate dehydrogenase E2 component (dihydrolipoamide acetyltransferase)
MNNGSAEIANVTTIKVPDIGDYTAVEVIELFVKSGDTIAAEDPLLTLETDKAAMEIPAPFSGTIQSMQLEVGHKVSAGDAILVLEMAAPETTNHKSINPSSPAEVEKTSGQAIEIVIPDLGVEGAVEIIEIAVTVGDLVQKEQTLLTLESDKAAMDIPSPNTGEISQLLVKVGDKVTTGTQVGQLLQANASAPQSSQKPATAAHQPAPLKAEPSVAESTDSDSAGSACAEAAEIHAGPATRRLARLLGIALTQITGSGRKGRITKADIYALVKQWAKSPPNTNGEQLAASPEIDFSQWGEIVIEPLGRIKKRSAQHLHRNWTTIPHVTHFDEVDITDLEQFRKAQQATEKPIKLTPLVFILKAIVSTLKEHPAFNSSLSADGQNLILKKYFHIGVAIDTPNGLVVPVLRDVPNKSLVELAQELSALSVTAREGKLKATQMQGSCFSISSLGGIGGQQFTPIINAPDVAILGVAKSQIKPIYQNGEFVPRLMLPLALSYDHRVIDGAQAARFMKYLVSQLQDIRQLLL